MITTLNKAVILTILFCIFSSIGYAQPPQGIPYQAIARNSAGNIIVSQPIRVRFSIHDSIAAGSIVYRETFTPTTNPLGLFNVNVGMGTVVSGTFSAINWGHNSKFMQVEMDPTGGTSYVDMGTTQMMSVPYALYAGNLPAGNSDGDILTWNGSIWSSSRNPFNEFLIGEFRRSASINGTASVALGWNHRKINTVASSQGTAITLDTSTGNIRLNNVGLYYVKADAIGIEVGGNHIVLQDYYTSAIYLYGTTQYSFSSGASSNSSNIEGIVQVTSSPITVFINHYTTYAQSYGLGSIIGSSSIVVDCRVFVQKIK